jgi:antitoxin Phd
MIAHQLQTAKQRFSSVAESAARGVPQLVTKHGKPFVIIVGAADWQKMHGPERSVMDALRACPEDLSELPISRSKDLPRKATL